jgi:two-component sensor histidine kinase
MPHVGSDFMEPRNAPTAFSGAPHSDQLRSMVSVEVLKQRPSRLPDYAAESQAIIALAQSMAVAPEGILQKLAETALTMCRGQSAGLSILEDADERKNFHWRALAGAWASHLNEGTPRDFSPCGTVLDRNAPHICQHAEVDFPTVQATVHLSHADTPDALKQVIEGRIQALANVHRLFVDSRWAGADIRGLVIEELTAYSQDREARVKVSGPECLLEPTTAQAIAVTLHELATNAAKYGALSVPDGRIQVEWSCEREGPIVLRWIETGGPPAEPTKHRGFGTRVMESMIRDQLKGELRRDWRTEGLACEIVLPGCPSGLTG